MQAVLDNNQRTTSNACSYLYVSLKIIKIKQVCQDDGGKSTRMNLIKSNNKLVSFYCKNGECKSALFYRATRRVYTKLKGQLCLMLAKKSNKKKKSDSWLLFDKSETRRKECY